MKRVAIPCTEKYAADPATSIALRNNNNLKNMSIFI
jgi:hypothetical protein